MGVCDRSLQMYVLESPCWRKCFFKHWERLSDVHVFVLQFVQIEESAQFVVSMIHTNKIGSWLWTVPLHELILFERGSLLPIVLVLANLLEICGVGFLYVCSLHEIQEKNRALLGWSCGFLPESCQVRTKIFARRLWCKFVKRFWDREGTVARQVGRAQMASCEAVFLLPEANLRCQILTRPVLGKRSPFFALLWAGGWNSIFLVSGFRLLTCPVEWKWRDTGHSEPDEFLSMLEPEMPRHFLSQQPEKSRHPLKIQLRPLMSTWQIHVQSLLVSWCLAISSHGVRFPLDW